MPQLPRGPHPPLLSNWLFFPTSPPRCPGAPGPAPDAEPTIFPRLFYQVWLGVQRENGHVLLWGSTKASRKRQLGADTGLSFRGLPRAPPSPRLPGGCPGSAELRHRAPVPASPRPPSPCSGARPLPWCKQLVETIRSDLEIP